MRKRLIVSAASALSLFLAVPASASGSGFEPGAEGVGDPYYPNFGNGGYRVSHYDIRLKYQPATDELEGTTTILAEATQNLSRFNLDFTLKVSEVRVNGRPATFTTSGEQELVITPARPLPKGSRATVVVRYKDVPSAVQRYGGYSAWRRTPDGAVVAGEPLAAAWWYPSNDHPSNKATFDVSVLVPDGSQVVSNGVLTGTSSQAGWTRYSWRENKPQATYLSMLGIGKFDITQDTTASGLPVYNAYGKDLGENAAAARASVERTGELVDFLSGYFGAYPFSSIGGFVPNIPSSGGLESQTRILYGPGLFARGSNASVVVHELAHQWYGDSVSLARWKDIWLNEGFAQYAQYLWSEHENEGTARELADYAYARYPAGDPFWSVKPGDPGEDEPLAWPVYLRGAMTIQALRTKLGDERFFRILKGWPTEHRYGNATVEDFEAYAEKVSGQKLGDFFTTWLFTPSKPPVGPSGTTPAALSAQGKDAVPAEPKSWKKIQEATEAVHANRR